MSSGKWRPFCLGLNVLISEIDKNILMALLSAQEILYTANEKITVRQFAI